MKRDNTIHQFKFKPRLTTYLKVVLERDCNDGDPIQDFSHPMDIGGLQEIEIFKY